MNIGRHRDGSTRPSLPRIATTAWSIARTRSVDAHQAAIAARPRPAETVEWHAASGLLLNCPCGIAVSADGDLYIADSGHHRVERVRRNGSADVVAGTGFDGFYGDGAPARRCRMTLPKGVALGPDRTIWIADSGNRRLRRIGPQGSIETVIGGDSIARLQVPVGVAVDRVGRAYLSDSLGCRIYRIDSLGVPTLVAGGGESIERRCDALRAMLFQPHGLAIDRAGSVYVADWGGHRVVRIDPDGLLEVVAGTPCERGGYGGDAGPAAFARLCYPRDIAVGPGGDLYIADSGNHRVRRIDNDGMMSTVAGAGRNGLWVEGAPAVETPLGYPTGLAIDRSGRIFIAESGENRIRRVDPDGCARTVRAST